MEEEMDETLRPGPAKKIWRRSESPPSFEGKDLESSPRLCSQRRLQARITLISGWKENI